MSFNVACVVGARPNFVKIGPLMRAFGHYPAQLRPLLIHTGQHYDPAMSGSFFRDLDIRQPDFYLGVGSGTHAEQTAGVMIGLEKVLTETRIDLLLVVGDVNSTLAAALTASKMQIPVGHIEAGLRSLDRTMPEELNRVVTDHLADLLFTPSEDASGNLRREGITPDRIFFVGNIMIDSLLQMRSQWEASRIHAALGLGHEDTSLVPHHHASTSGYALVTLHRPSNVDESRTFEQILGALSEIQKHVIVLFPMHPRTRRRLVEQCGNWGERFRTMPNVVLAEPFDYLDFIHLEAYAKFVLTDSGGVQEETTALNVPCLTLRENTERPVTVTMGTNVIVGTDSERIINEALSILEGNRKIAKPIPLWDGKTANRIIDIIVSESQNRAPGDKNN